MECFIIVVVVFVIDTIMHCVVTWSKKLYACV